MSIDLSVPDLEALHERRSEKWALHERDVLSATIAEMDFPLAEPVAEAISSALARNDLGYPVPAPASLRRSFAEFARRRLDWGVDEQQVELVPDVMIGLIELCRVVAPRGEPVAFATPAYPPFYRALPQAGVKLIELGLDPGGRLDLGALDAALAAGARALVLASPHNPTGHVPRASRTRGDRRTLRRAWRLGTRRRDPRATDSAGRQTHAVARGLGRGATLGSRADVSVEGLQPRGAQGCAGRDR